jgi:16S rRNA (cytidine1402-2'-O)-methyltransferase
LFVPAQCQNARRMSGTLYIVATPIGNLEDITQRALRVLREVDLVACEDTRHTQRLLNHFGIKTKTVSYHEHNERERSEELCRLLESGKNIALVSDAGTPLVSDPGFRVVNAAIERDFSIVAIPGAAAFVAALVASGMPVDQFLFVGFLPSRTNARRVKLETLREVPATLIFYEAPHRLAAALKDALAVLGNRRAVVARELTKLHEEIARGSLADLTKGVSDRQLVRGEIVLIIGSEAIVSSETESTQVSPQRLSERVSELEREGVNAKDALKRAAREFGMKRAEAYRMMVDQKKRRSR